MPRRRQRGILRWRRRRLRQPPPQVIQLRGRRARAFMRDITPAREEAGEGREGNGAAPVNDVLARTGTWKHRRGLPPVAWGTGIAVLGAVLRETPNPILFGILGGIASGVVMVGFTRHLSAFGRRWCDVAAFLTAGWVPALAVAGFGKPVPVLLATTWLACSVPWWRHYRIRPGEGREEQEEIREEMPSADEAVWARLAAKRKWSGSLTDREDIPGGRKWQIKLDGSETHIGQVMAEPRAVAAAWDRAQTEAYAEPHPTGVESRGVLTILRAGTLQETREWDGCGFGEDGIARVARYADSQPVRIRAWVPRDGARHGLVAGTTRAGKSELLNLLIWLALTSEIPVVPVILDPQNGQSLPQWQGKVLYAAGVEACARMRRGLNAGMMDRSRRLASMTWDDDGHRAKGMQFFDARLSGLPVVMAITDEAPLLLSGDGNAKLAVEMTDLTARAGKLGGKAGESEWLVAQVPSLAELGGDQALRSMLVGGNVIALRTGDKVSAGMIGLDADPSALPKYFPDGSPTQGIGYAVTMDNRQAPMRTDIVPSRMRHQPVIVPQLEDEFLESMDRAMGGVSPTTAYAAPSVMKAIQEAGMLLDAYNREQARAEAEQQDEPPEGRRCVDAVWQVLRARGGEMEKGEVIAAAKVLVTTEWGRSKPFVIRSVTAALTDLASGKYPDRPVVKPRDGVYEALAPRGEIAANDQGQGTA